MEADHVVPGETPAVNAPAETADNGAPGETTSNPADQVPYEVRETINRGRGLFARKDVAEGARIIVEKPLLLVTVGDSQTMTTEMTLGLRALPREKQRQFLSLHNAHHRRERHPFLGIFFTNALVCGTACQGAICATLSLVNHSCVPNAHATWHREKEQATVHAIRPIRAGEEITISYTKMMPYDQRHEHLTFRFRFTCDCPVCSLPQPARAESDRRRARITQLDGNIGVASRVQRDRKGALDDCAELEQLLFEEFGGKPDHAVLARLYNDAFQVVIAHGDRARASVFAARAYKERVLSAGEDSVVAREWQRRAEEDPGSHPSFKLYSSAWNTPTALVPEGLNEADFRAWLFRQQ